MRSLLLLVGSAWALDPKHLAGPPEGFLPPARPQTGDVDASSVSFIVDFDVHADSVAPFEASIPVDTKDGVVLSLYSQLAEHITVRLTSPHGVPILMVPVKDSIALDGQTYPSTTFLLPILPTTGVYQLTLDTSKLSLPQVQLFARHLEQGMRHAFVAMHFPSPVLLESWSSNNLVVQGTQSIYAGLTNNDTKLWQQPHHPGPRAPDKITSASVFMQLPDGTTSTVPMRDDGVAPDVTANDGLFSASMLLQEQGYHLAQVIVDGEVDSGTPFRRTATHMWNVVTDDLDLGTSATFTPKNDGFVQIDIPVTKAPAALKRYRAYAEVYGMASDGKYFPIAWAGGITQQGPGVDSVSLSFHSNYTYRAMSKKGIQTSLPSYQLRNLRVEDTESWVSIESTRVVSVRNLLRVPSVHVPAGYVDDGKVTEAMIWGPRPAHRTRALKAGTAKLALVHGYCSGANPFTKDDFTDAVVFEDLSANRPIDVFATILSDFLDTLGGPASIVAHSQGGLASTHLKQYYWSPLDQHSEGTTGRIIQTVGSPYQGCTIAGDVAALGAIFGAGCGKNEDMTRNGAPRWLQQITPEVRSLVYYYTTQYDDKSFFSKYCNLGTNVIGSTPNDGTTEVKYADLPGGNHVGHTVGWCHTTGMKYPPQGTDASRNKEMSAAASR